MFGWGVCKRGLLKKTINGLCIRFSALSAEPKVHSSVFLEPFATPMVEAARTGVLTRSSCMRFATVQGSWPQTWSAFLRFTPIRDAQQEFLKPELEWPTSGLLTWLAHALLFSCVFCGGAFSWYQTWHALKYPWTMVWFIQKTAAENRSHRTLCLSLQFWVLKVEKKRPVHAKIRLNRGPILVDWVGASCDSGSLCLRANPVKVSHIASSSSYIGQKMHPEICTRLVIPLPEQAEREKGSQVMEIFWDCNRITIMNKVLTQFSLCVRVIYTNMSMNCLQTKDTVKGEAPGGPLFWWFLERFDSLGACFFCQTRLMFITTLAQVHLLGAPCVARLPSLAWAAWGFQ